MPFPRATADFRPGTAVALRANRPRSNEAGKTTMKGRILIVDDELELLSAINDYLTSRGYDCECASETAEAMALLAHIPFDVVLTDIYLSPLVQPDGLAVISFIRERALASRVI